MSLIHILVDSFADQHLTNAQMTNARDIVQRLDPDRFHVSIFHEEAADPLVTQRPNTRLIRLPQRRKTPRILREFIFGRHEILFYLKASPASKWYLQIRCRWMDFRPVIGTVEGMCEPRVLSSPISAEVKLWEQTILRSDYIFSNTVLVKESLEKVYGRSSEIVPTGVDTNFFSPGKECSLKSRVRVLFGAALVEYKEPQTVVRAAARFPDADFVLAGEGSLASELQLLVKRENLANVRFTGALTRDALREEYRQADIFFYPSHWDGSPKVVMEAAACGLPVIVRNNYKPETVINGQTGYVVASDDELFARLGELLQSPDRCRVFGRAGREHIKQFDWDPITHQWEEVFEQMMSEKNGCTLP